MSVSVQSLANKPPGRPLQPTRKSLRLLRTRACSVLTPCSARAPPRRGSEQASLPLRVFFEGAIDYLIYTTHKLPSDMLSSRALLLAACVACAVAQCSMHTSCATCAFDFSCAWCQKPSTVSSVGTCVAYSASCPSTNGKYYAVSTCPSNSTCSSYTSAGCASCTGSSSCEWWSPSSSSSASGGVCASVANTYPPSTWTYFPIYCNAVQTLSSAIIAVIVLSVFVVCVIPTGIFIAICFCGCALCGFNRRRQSQYVAIQQQQAYAALAFQPGAQPFPGTQQFQPQQQYQPQQQPQQYPQYPQQYNPQQPAYAPPAPYTSAPPQYAPSAPSPKMV